MISETRTDAEAVDLDFEAILAEAGVDVDDVAPESLATAMRAIAW